MASGVGHLYYCHQCSQTVQPSNPGELICPNCNGDFLEEWSGPAQDEPPTAAHGPGIDLHTWNYMAPGFGQLLEDMSSFLTHMHMVQAAEGGGTGGGGHLRLGSEPGDMNPILLLRGRIQNLLNMRNGELIIDSGAGGTPHRLPGSIGDYFIGPGFEQFIQQLAENDPNRYGAPPASKSAVEALPTIVISEEHLGTDAAQCAVCKDEFEVCAEVKQMPCKHLYHQDCILPWLAQHNSCPMCRYELPTDDPDYEQVCVRGQSTGSTSNASTARAWQGGGERGPGGFSIQGIPRQFLVGRLPTETSNASQQTREQPTLVSEDSNSSDNREARAQGTGRRFSITFPWFRGLMTTFMSPANNAQAGNTSQSNTTAPSSPGGVANEAGGQAMADQDGDMGTSDARQERSGQS